MVGFFNKKLDAEMEGSIFFKHYFLAKKKHGAKF
jgi:hypothetical protein